MDRRNFIRNSAASVAILAATPVVIADAVAASAAPVVAKASYGTFSVWQLVGTMDEVGNMDFTHYYPEDKPEDKRYFK